MLCSIKKVISYIIEKSLFAGHKIKIQWHACFHLSADHNHVSSDSWMSNQHSFGSASLVCTKTSLVVLY